MSKNIVHRAPEGGPIGARSATLQREFLLQNCASCTNRVHSPGTAEPAHCPMVLPSFFCPMSKSAPPAEQPKPCRHQPLAGDGELLPRLVSDERPGLTGAPEHPHNLTPIRSPSRIWEGLPLSGLFLGAQLSSGGDPQPLPHRRKTRGKPLGRSGDSIMVLGLPPVSRPDGVEKTMDNPLRRTGGAAPP